MTGVPCTRLSNFLRVRLFCFIVVEREWPVVNGPSFDDSLRQGLIIEHLSGTSSNDYELRPALIALAFFPSLFVPSEDNRTFWVRDKEPLVS